MTIFKAEISTCCSEEQLNSLHQSMIMQPMFLHTFSAKQLLSEDFIGTWVTPLKDIFVYMFAGSLGKL